MNGQQIFALCIVCFMAGAAMTLGLILLGEIIERGKRK